MPTENDKSSEENKPTENSKPMDVEEPEKSTDKAAIEGPEEAAADQSGDKDPKSNETAPVPSDETATTAQAPASTSAEGSDPQPMDTSAEQEPNKKTEGVEPTPSAPVSTSAIAAPAQSGTAAAPPAPAEAAEKPKAAVQIMSMEERSGKFAAMARKRGREEKQVEEKQEEKKEEKPAVPTTYYVTDDKGRKVKVIDDDVEEMDCEFLNNRQAFLNLCQGNHYQFDHLRRAKHSSMMVLWHLHNRDAPKFVQQCTTCSREILTGYRFHCPTCADFDQCQECVQNPNTPRHPHRLKPIPVASQQNELTEAQRKERQRSIQLHMTLLLHAATCTSPKCPSANCTKMKGLLKHGAQCQQKATGGCNVCKRIWALLQIHARQCKAASCPVPNCMAIRQRVRQLKKQQQAMDDRRRQEMNRVYRGAR